MLGIAGNPASWRQPKNWVRLQVVLRAVVLVCLALAGCSPGRGLPDLPAAETMRYRLGAGDVVRLITFGEDSLTGEFRVSDGGTIALPLLGVVKAAGLSPEQLGKQV